MNKQNFKNKINKSTIDMRLNKKKVENKQIHWKLNIHKLVVCAYKTTEMNKQKVYKSTTYVNKTN